MQRAYYPFTWEIFPLPFEEQEVDTTPPRFITFGIFPQLQALTEEDFKSAEWHGEDFKTLMASKHVVDTDTFI